MNTFNSVFHIGVRIFARTFAVFGMVVSLLVSTSHAEVVSDGTAGAAGNVPLTQGVYTIDPAFGTLSGSNLFHSFSSFNINTGETALFSAGNTSGAANIIGRVTGGGLSTVDGIITSDILGANLWLVNPNGFVFGPDSQISIEGSFFASTGEYVKFADNAIFDAVNPNDPALIVANPTGFGFVSNNPGAITLDNANLRVSNGQSISLVGGDVELNASMIGTIDGRLNIAAVHGPGEVTFTVPNSPAESGIVFNATGGSFNAVNMTDSSLDLSGAGFGAVYIMAGQFVMSGDSSITSRSDAISTAVIHVDATEAVMQGGLISSSGSVEASAADIHIEGGKFTINGGRITSTAVDIGSAGDITIVQAQEFTMDNGSIQTSSASAAGGNITIQAADLVSLTNSTIATDINGATPADPGGNISIDPVNVVINKSQINAQSNDANSGNLTILGGAVFLDSASQVAATGQTTIQTIVKDENFNQDVAALPEVSETFVDITAVLTNRCASEVIKNKSSFTIELDKSGESALDEFNYIQYLAATDPRGMAVENFQLALANFLNAPCF